MATERNPFTPAFGTSPYVLAGRDAFLETMRTAFESGVGDPNLSTLIVGARGTGKTALMSRVRDLASEDGWVAVGTTALPGMLEDIYERVTAAAEHLVDTSSAPRISSVSLGPVAASWETASEAAGNWRTRMTKLLDALALQDIGLLITVDEVQGDFDELVHLAADYQHFVTENRKVSLVMAGLPFHVDRLVSNKSVSFLRRCAQYRIGGIPSSDVREALRITIQDAGKDISPEALERCVEATEGFAYMLQLVGFRTWNAARAEDVISEASAVRGIAAAQKDMEEHVLAATYRELSNKDVLFLEAMLLDRYESSMAVIAGRMGVSTGYAATYKSRLLSFGVIKEQSRGKVAFDLPGLREYVAMRKE